MKIGQLRHRVTIQQKTETADAYGGAGSIAWSDYITVWAAVAPLSGREFLEGRNLENEINYRIRIRYRSGLDPSMRVSWDSRIFDIEAVLNRFEENREIWLMCREIVS